MKRNAADGLFTKPSSLSQSASTVTASLRHGSSATALRVTRYGNLKDTSSLLFLPEEIPPHKRVGGSDCCPSRH
jgi:hypothetical protein